MSSRLYQKGLPAATMLRKEPRFKRALLALRVNFQSELLDWDKENANKPLKAYFEARCLLHNIEVDLNLAWAKFEALDKNVDEFFKSCSCLVSAIGRLENIKNAEDQDLASEHTETIKKDEQEWQHSLDERK